MHVIPTSLSSVLEGASGQSMIAKDHYKFSNQVRHVFCTFSFDLVCRTALPSVVVQGSVYTTHNLYLLQSFIFCLSWDWFSIWSSG